MRDGVTDPTNRSVILPPNGASDVANVRLALQKGQFQLIAPTTAAGITALAFPGVAVGEDPTGGAAGMLRWRNGDNVPHRIRKIYIANADQDPAQAFEFRLRIGNNALHSGFIHSGTVTGNTVALSLGEGFLVFPGDTLFVDAFAQVAAPVPMTFRMVFGAQRITNFANLPVGTSPAELKRTIDELNKRADSLNSRKKMADAYQRDLRRRWWAFVNGVGEVGGVGNDRATYGFGAVDLTAAPLVVSGFENEQTGPFIWETLQIFTDQGLVPAGGFQIAQIETSDDTFISPQGGPIRSDVLAVTPATSAGFFSIPYVLDVPLIIEPNQTVRITFQTAPGLSPANVWCYYGGTLDGDPYR